MSWILQIKHNPGIILFGELVLVAIILGTLLWKVQALHASLPVATKWANYQIARGEAQEKDREQLIAAYRAAYSWQDSAGEFRTYPISRDSYYFLRLARNIVETGTICPGSPSDKPCYDMQVNALDGRPMVSARSPHPWAIAMLYKILKMFGTEPSLLQVGRLHNRLMLLVCGLLAYLFVRQLSPGIALGGGLAAAVTLVLLPAVIERCFGVDNDVWVLALLLAGTLAIAYFLKSGLSETWHWFSLIVVLLSLFLLQATWGGWIFLLILQCSTTAIIVSISTIRKKNWHPRRDTVIRIIVLTGILMLALVYIFLPDWLIDKFTVRQIINNTPPPDAFSTVAELVPIKFNDVIKGITWPVLFTTVIGLIAAIHRLWARKCKNLPALLLILAWLVGVVMMLVLFRYTRFLILLGPTAAILSGMGINAVVDLLRRPFHRSMAITVLSLIMMISVSINAIALLKDNRPQLNSAWVTVLDKLSHTTPADSILVGWWNAGHWIAYWSRRLITVDGASLRSSRIHDVGRLLATDNEGNLDSLINQAACDKKTECGHPIYLLTADDLLHELGWMISGFWLPERALLVDQIAANVKPANNVPADLLAEARNVSNNVERSLFSAPAARIWSTDWSPCNIDTDSNYICPLNVTSENGWLVKRLVIPGGQINMAYLVVQESTGNEPLSIKPSLMRIATPDRLYDSTFDASSNNPGILLDTVKRRAFLGTPAMLRSLMARLVLLDGRYDQDRFDRIFSARTVDGHQVTAWRVRQKLFDDLQSPGQLQDE